MDFWETFFIKSGSVFPIDFKNHIRQGLASLRDARGRARAELHNSTKNVPSIPERPRVLSSSSSSSSDSLPELVDDLPRLRISVVPNDQQARDPRDESPPRDFFSFGATNEHHTIMRYVQQFVTGTFDHSTDSETDDDESNKEEMPPLE